MYWCAKVSDNLYFRASDKIAAKESEVNELNSSTHRWKSRRSFSATSARDIAAIGINLVGNMPEQQRHLAASGIVSAFKNIWFDSWGPRLEYILYATVAALLECNNVSLLGVQRMLHDARYRAWVVKQVKDPIVRSFWINEFEAYEKSFLREVVAPLQNKVGQLLMSPHLRNVLGQVRSAIDASFIMDNGKIFIANLSKGTLGADKSNLIGALLVTQFQLGYSESAGLKYTTSSTRRRGI